MFGLRKNVVEDCLGAFPCRDVPDLNFVLMDGACSTREVGATAIISEIEKPLQM